LNKEGGPVTSMCRNSKRLPGGVAMREDLLSKNLRELNGSIRRKLAEAEEPPTTIGEWQERAVRLDRNQRQNRIEEKTLGRNAAHPGENTQHREGGSYRGRGGQITWRTEGGYRGGGGKNTFNRRGTQVSSRRDLNAMDINRGRGGDRTCYMCKKWGHMTKNCWERHKRRVVEMPQELAKENGGQ